MCSCKHNECWLNPDPKPKLYCPTTKTNVINVLKLNPIVAAIWFKTHNYISASSCENVCVKTTPIEKADTLLDILVQYADGLKALICYLREEQHAQLAAVIEKEINNKAFSSEYMTTKLPALTTRYDSATCKFLSDLKQFTRQYCEIIRQHWKDNLAVDNLDNAYVPLTLANEKELSPKYKWNHDDLQQLAFLYVDEVRIFITGEPGFGKSTFLNKIAYDWAADKSPALTKHFDFIYYLPLNEAAGNNLSEAILAHLAFDDKETSSAVINKCFTENSYRPRTLFLLDAYDEANLTSFPVITRIAEGREHPLAKCVITSRPLQVDLFPKPIHISARGFDASAQADYITKHVHDKGRRAQLMGVHKEGMAQVELFKSPFFLTVVCLLANYNKTFNFQGQSALFELLREYHVWLLAKTVEMKKIQISVKDYDSTLIEAGKFALREMLHSNDRTKDKELIGLLESSVGSSNDHTLLKRAVQLGAMTAKTVRGIANPLNANRTTYGFLHKLLAEYLCALYLKHLISSTKASWWTSITSTGMPAEMLPRLLPGHYRHFGMISYFLSGLSKDYFDAVVQHLLTMTKDRIRIPCLCDTFEIPQCKPRIIRDWLEGYDLLNTVVSTALLAALLSGGSADRSIRLAFLYLQSGWLSTAMHYERLNFIACTIPSSDESWQLGTVSTLAKVELFHCEIHSFHFLQHLTLQELRLREIYPTDKVWLQLFAALQAGLSASLQVLQLRCRGFISLTVIEQLPAALAHMQVLRHLELLHRWYTDGLLSTILLDLSGTLEILTLPLIDETDEKKLTQTCTKLTRLVVESS